ncbi:MAG: hypothetical protein IV100_31240 [Myxococcales bacterium]|nr:hypothetical protein [Myxococcales bacterium]
MMRVSLRSGSLLAVLPSLVLAACGDDELESAAATPLEIQTALPFTALVAGESVTVTCAGVRGTLVDGSVTTFELIVSPDQGLERAGLDLRFTAAGSYSVACRAPLFELTDPSPETVVVTPAAAATATIALEPPTSAAGEPVTRRCVLRDDFGNPIDSVASSVVTPADGYSEAASESAGISTLMAQRAGQYVVQCRWDGTSVTSPTTDWEVLPGPAAEVVVKAIPEQPAYPKNAKVDVQVDVYDAYGNVVATGVPAESLEASTGATVTGSSVTLGESGTTTITATFAGASGDVTLAIDPNPPTLVVKDPTRGTTIDGEAFIQVSGQVNDDRGLGPVFAGDVELPTDGEGRFSTQIPAHYGVNTIHFKVSDLAGNLAQTWRSAVWSSEWFEMISAAPEADRVPGGATLVLTQAIFDDGMTPGNIGGVVRPKDIADIAQIILANVDLKSLAPEPLANWWGCDYHLDELEIEDADVKITLEPGYAKLEFTLYGFSLKVSNSGGFLCSFHWGKEPGELLSGTGPLNFSAKAIKAMARVSATALDGSTEVTVDLDDLVLEGTYNVDIIVIDDIVDGFFNIFLGLFKGILGDVVSNLFSTLFDSLNLNQALDVPVLGSDTPNSVRLETRPGKIAFEDDRVIVALDARARADSPKRPHEVLGSPRYAGCGTPAALPDSFEGAALVALHDDLLNQIFFSIWDGGSLDLSLAGDALGDIDLAGFGVTDLVAKVDASLAPVVNGCDGAAEVEIGDLYIDATFNMGGTPTRMAFWVQGKVGLTFTVGPDANGQSAIDFALSGLDALTFEVVANEGIFAGNDEGLISLVKDALIPQLLGGALDDLGPIALPAIPLSTLLPGVPEGLELRIGLTAVETGGGLTRATGGLE